jgi:hypothetical protein
MGRTLALAGLVSTFLASVPAVAQEEVSELEQETVTDTTTSDKDPWEGKSSFADRDTYFTKIGMLVLENQVNYDSAVKDPEQDLGAILIDYNSELYSLIVGLLEANDIPLGDNIGFNCEDFYSYPDRLTVHVHYQSHTNFDLPVCDAFSGWTIFEFYPDRGVIEEKCSKGGPTLTSFSYDVE